MRSNVLINIACLFLILSCNKEYYKSTNGEYKIYSSSEISNKNFNSIRAIDLSDDMNSLPSRIFQMENLLYLNLNNKNLKNIPADICKLKSLKVLLLNGNRFDQIPEMFV
jgi:Leucine-rich repeat (LRR) protein